MARKRAEIHVVAGALFDADGRVLLAQRPVGKHLAGRWEFPGGKLREGESVREGLSRELAEELGVELEAAEPLMRFHHDYPDRRVLLDVWRVTRYRGEPRALDAQALDWVKPDEMHIVDLLEADRPIITALRLPQVAVRLRGIAALQEAGRQRRPMTLFWMPGDCEPSASETREAVRTARRRGNKVIIAGKAVESAVAAAASGADGMLLPGGSEMSVDPAGSFLVGEVCRTAAAARAAEAAGAHFLVLAPSARRFDEKQVVAALTGLKVPAFVGWYPDDASLAEVRRWGAHGCAVSGAPPTGSHRAR